MEWRPTQFFRDDASPPVPFAVLVLNQPINEKAFAVLRKHACFIICADGGANRYYDLMKTHGKEAADLPNAIVGDLDSIIPSVRNYYESLGVRIIHDPDQYSTDFTKCLKYLRSNASLIINQSSPSHPNPFSDKPPPRLDILILGGLGGRVDQAFSQIHHLSAMSQSENPGDLYLISEESISFVLQRGRNVIHTPGTNRPAQTQTPPQSDGHDHYYLEENTGILPISGPAVISTEGLEWDVSDWRTEMGGQISTSNHIRADVVRVETNQTVLFTAELAQRFKVGGKER